MVSNVDYLRGMAICAVVAFPSISTAPRSLAPTGAHGRASGLSPAGQQFQLAPIARQTATIDQ